MKLLPLAGAIGLAFAPLTHATELLANYQWNDAPGARSGEVIGTGQEHYLRVKNTNHTGLRVQLLKIEKPAVSSQLYALRGQVRYETVAGDGFLEMWNIFPPAKPGGTDAQYFSRTLGDSGEMGKITGSSDWRAFTLPFNMTGTKAPPSRLEVNLILPGSGQVDLKEVQLVQFSGNTFAKNTTLPWWTEKQAGLIGGVGGSLLGCLGALIGTLGAKRKAQTFVVATSKGLIALGIILALVFVVALAQGQPFFVWYLPCLSAILLLTVIPAQLKRLRNTYTEAEMRRMAAADSIS